MISAVDTNILLDVFLPDPDFGPASRELLDLQFKKGRLVICDVVYAELAGVFPSRRVLDDVLAVLQIEFSPMDAEAAHAAGSAWKRYRSGGGPRQRVIADFLIGAHALCAAEYLCTRDRGFYRRYFPHLRVIEPE